MNRSMIVVAVLLCAGCAHTSPTVKSEADQIASNAQLADAQQTTCARGEIAYCKATQAAHFPGAQKNEQCTCGPNNLYSTYSRWRVTGPTPGERVR
jgi:outer membrane murein-binding lipoprotein Lpp